MAEPADHVVVNMDHWNRQAHEWVARGERSWRMPEPVWGIWETSEEELSLLPDDMSGMQAIELGCGTAYVSGWMARRGAGVVGIDISIAQLETARRLASENDVDLTLIQGTAEDVPLSDATFDFAISEYGAALWCDPYLWIPEAHRLLKPGAELVLLSNSTLSVMCSPADGSLPVTERLERDYFSIHRQDWRDATDDPGGIEFNLPISGWFRLFRETGFEVLDFMEVQAPRGGPEVNFFATGAWAHRFPSEQAWRVRKAT